MFLEKSVSGQVCFHWRLTPMVTLALSIQVCVSPRRLERQTISGRRAQIGGCIDRRLRVMTEPAIARQALPGIDTRQRARGNLPGSHRPAATRHPTSQPARYFSSLYADMLVMNNACTCNLRVCECVGSGSRISEQTESLHLHGTLLSWRRQARIKAEVM